MPPNEMLFRFSDFIHPWLQVASMTLQCELGAACTHGWNSKKDIQVERNNMYTNKQVQPLIPMEKATFEGATSEFPEFELWLKIPSCLFFGVRQICWENGNQRINIGSHHFGYGFLRPAVRSFPFIEWSISRISGTVGNAKKQPGS